MLIGYALKLCLEDFPKKLLVALQSLSECGNKLSLLKETSSAYNDDFRSILFIVFYALIFLLKEDRLFALELRQVGGYSVFKSLESKLIYDENIYEKFLEVTVSIIIIFSI